MDRITDRPDMTSAVYSGRKASTHNSKPKEVRHQNSQVMQMCSIMNSLIMLRKSDRVLCKFLMLD